MSYISYEDMSDHEGCSLRWTDTQVHQLTAFQQQHTFAAADASESDYFSDDASPISIPGSDTATEAELTIEEDAAQRAWLMFNRVAKHRHGLVSPSPSEEAALENFMSSLVEQADEASKLDALAAAAQEDLVFTIEL